MFLDSIGIQLEKQNKNVCVTQAAFISKTKKSEYDKKCLKALRQLQPCLVRGVSSWSLSLHSSFQRDPRYSRSFCKKQAPRERPNVLALLLPDPHVLHIPCQLNVLKTLIYIWKQRHFLNNVIKTVLTPSVYCTSASRAHAMHT